MPIISIILPVYNVGEYLTECLDSIANQNFIDFECICVNDGSTDNSLLILQEYSKKDRRFRFIDKKNEGVSIARNIGIEASCGEYIAFMDSDDWIDKNYLCRLYEEANKNNADIVSCNFKFYHSKDNVFESARVKKIDIVSINSDDFERLYKGYHGAYVWRKLYKASIIKNNSIKFYPGKTSEDGPFSGLVYLYAKKIIFICDELYFHRKQIKSLTSNTERQDFDALYCFITLTHEVKNRGFYDTKIRKFLIDTFIYKIGKLGKSVSNEKQKILLSDVITHLDYLFLVSKEINIIYVLKVIFVQCMIRNFGIKSFAVFRILKNIM